MDERVGKIKINELSFNSMKRGAKAQQNDQADGESSHWSLSKTVKFLPRIFKNKPHRLKDGESVA